jgi:hypothetical protein
VEESIIFMETNDLTESYRTNISDCRDVMGNTAKRIRSSVALCFLKIARWNKAPYKTFKLHTKSDSKYYEKYNTMHNLKRVQ